MIRAFVAAVLATGFAVMILCAWLADERANRTERFARTACEATAGKDACR